MKTMTDSEKRSLDGLSRMLGSAESFNYVEYAMKSGESYSEIRKRVLFGISAGILTDENNGSFTVNREILSGDNLSKRQNRLCDISDKLATKMIDIVDSVLREPGIDKDAVFRENAIVAFLTRRMISSLTEMKIIRCEGDKLYPEIGKECWEMLKQLYEHRPH